MASVCPHCQAEMADKNSLCDHCGKSALFDEVQNAPPQSTPPESVSRVPLWKILPWAALAVLLLFLLPRLLSHKTPLIKSAAAAPMPPVTTPMSAAIAPPETVTVPLTVTLDSASHSRHVAQGASVTLSAYAALAPGQSATLAVSYVRNKSSKSLLSLAQGSLLSTTWTPTAPGHYEFTASALDSRKTSAFSQHLSFWVEAPKSIPAPPSRVAPVETAPKGVPIPAPPIHAAAKHRAQVQFAKHSTAKRITVKRITVKHSAAKPIHHPTTALPYHVAAATFTYRPVAETLAGALRRRGFHAFVRSSPGIQGKPTYAVETGDYPSHSDAQQQMRLLQRDGYPAALFRLRPR